MTKSKNFWNKVALKYSKQPISDMESYNRKLVETRALMTPYMNVLEIGCGTGSTAISHAPYVKRIVATDSAQEMVNIGQENAKDAGIENITFIKCKIEELEAQNANYDMILSLNLFHLLEDRQSALSIIYQQLKPGGVFVSSTPCLADNLWFLRPLLSLLALFGKAPAIKLFRLKTFLREIENAGFEHDYHWTHGHSHVVFLVSRKTV